MDQKPSVDTNDSQLLPTVDYPITITFVGNLTHRYLTVIIIDPLSEVILLLLFIC